MSQSSKSIQTGPCLCSRCFRISTCISYTYCPWDFQSGIFVLIFRSTEPAHKTLPVDFSVLSRSIVFLRCIPYWFSKPGVLGSHLPCAGFKGWGTKCGNLIPHSSGKDLQLYNPPDCGSLQLQRGLVLGMTTSLYLFLLSVSALSLYPLLWRFFSFRRELLYMSFHM